MLEHNYLLIVIIIYHHFPTFFLIFHLSSSFFTAFHLSSSSSSSFSIILVLVPPSGRPLSLDVFKVLSYEPIKRPLSQDSQESLIQSTPFVSCVQIHACTYTHIQNTYIRIHVIDTYTYTYVHTYILIHGPGVLLCFIFSG